MPSPDARLILFAFPQRWDAGSLGLRVLALPRGNPLAPLPGTSAPFASAQLAFDAVVIPGTETLPDPGIASHRFALAEVARPQKAAIFDALATSFEIKPVPAAPATLPSGTAFRKYLTPSYREASGFRRPRTPFVVTDESYACAVRDATPAERATPPSRAVSWGQVYSFLLRQPRLAEAAGLVQAATVDVPATALADGGWLYVDLRAGSTYAAELGAVPGALARFAARVPPVTASERRALFGAVQFPVVPPPPPGPPQAYDAAAVESVAYDDGFAKIVHGQQPRTMEAVDGVGATPLSKDLGIRLGWDDEQVVIWMNRQIRPDPGDPTRPEVDVPMGVSGYRVDVREAGRGPWRSLVKARARLTLGPQSLGTFDDELSVEAVPIQLEAKDVGDYWLPSYFATWRGSSLVFPDRDEIALSGRDSGAPSALEPVDDRLVALRYGRDYEFRVRLRDLTGGGPGPDDARANPAPAPTAVVPFRRHVPPQPVISGSVPALVPGARTITIPIYRPRLSYPAALFTNLPDATAALLADLDVAKEEGREPAIPDPDVTWLDVLVEVEGLQHDIDPGSLARDHLVPLYTSRRAFPPDAATPLSLDVEFQDAPDVFALRRPDPLAPEDGTGPLLLPTARAVRLSLVAIGKADPDLAYFGSESARVGVQAVRLELRAPAADERALFRPATAAPPIRALFLRPDPPATPDVAAQAALAGRQDEAPGDGVARLAKTISLESSGLVVHGRPGRRTVFGASAALRHTLARDASSIAFASTADLTHQWIVAIRLRLARDWTWDGLDATSVQIARDDQVVGSIDVPRSVYPAALIDPDRSGTELVFFDAIDPKPDAGEFPDEITVRYEARSRLRDAPPSRDANPSWTMRLPVATPPRETPVLASAGLALSPYVVAPDYSSTEMRRRRLWLELAEPPRDPRDRVYARVLACAPDPMLLPDVVTAPDPKEPPLPIDPELVRAIVADQPADSAGLDAMQELVPSESSRHHFVLPLPPGLTDAAEELFGFFVYEVRIGHDGQRWCTAQGRFGPPLRVTGVQHPAPPLTCLVTRSMRTIDVTAPFAAPILDGRAVRPAVPRTAIWALLYAQVHQADGAAYRNVLLARTPARFTVRGDNVFAAPWDGYGLSVFEESATQAALEALGLPRHAPLSVVAVELLPEARHEDARDPLGASLGQVRILRTSPLTPVPPAC